MTANVRNCSLREAAEFWNGGWREYDGGKRRQFPAGFPPARDRERAQAAYYLQASHEAVQGLGVSETAQDTWGGLRSQRASCADASPIPVHDPAGILLAYCRGRAVKDESPLFALPQRLRSAHRDLQAHRIVEGDLFLVRDPLQVLTAHESGIENVVAFLTET